MLSFIEHLLWKWHWMEVLYITYPCHINSIILESETFNLKKLTCPTEKKKHWLLNSSSHHGRLQSNRRDQAGTQRHNSMIWWGFLSQPSTHPLPVLELVFDKAAKLGKKVDAPQHNKVQKMSLLELVYVKWSFCGFFSYYNLLAAQSTVKPTALCPASISQTWRPYKTSITAETNT